MIVTFVTGASCAGKTTAGQAVRDSWADHGVMVRDLDEDAPARPSTAWLDWLRWRAAEELQRATDLAAAEGQAEATADVGHVLVTGITWPLRLIESPAWAPARRAGVCVRFVLLDPPWKVLRGRLEERLADKSKTERRETIRYNRALRTVLREQVLAVRRGFTVTEALCPDDLAVGVLGSWTFHAFGDGQ